ncbi:hypothetical protein [Polyangium aurulentum]|uniref:hypothetical protein n=1 Tax=Polyangium aurulentum TaxID=2567896 RepID=UPI0010AE5641|nr:hypothetical protein [Polyangium aurulentum]UQA55919.1 hypothetical protein E8A73_031930 [Polyangium aurulentum]
MRSSFLSHGALRRLGALASLVGAAWLLSAVPASADDSAATAKTDPSPAGETAPAVLTTTPSRATVEPDKAPEKPAEKPSAGGGGSSAKKRRGGIHPCMTPDPGWGIYDRWSSAPSIGQMIAPHKGGITKKGSFDLIVHFHGHEPIRKEFVKAAKGSVLVGIDLGIGSGVYGSTFASPTAFTQLIDSVEAAMAKKTGNKNAKVRKIALSAWSAGYGAIEQILRQPAAKRVDAVILLDSLHAGYADERQKALKTVQIDPFVAFAKRAASKQAFMFMSHSSILPPGYASTTEVASYVIGELHGKPKKAKRADVLGLDMIRRYDKGNFHVRGYTGEDKPDHCAHIGLMADIVRVHLEPRWKTPRGKL